MTALTTAPGIPTVEMRGVVRRFGPVLAVDRVDFRAHAGEVHALVGENGAGKSTLMRVLAGVLAPDAGSIRVRGDPVGRLDVPAAIRLGIGMVHQHFMLVEPLTVSENLVLGREPRRRGLLDRGAARRAVEALTATYGLYVDPDARVEDLSVGERQRVEILKVLHRGADILVLDEPTAVLTPGESRALLALLRRFAESGRTVVLITHRLDEVLAVADRITVMRQGRVVGEMAAAGTSARDLAHRMVGREVALAALGMREAPAPDAGRSFGGAPALEVRDLVVNRGGTRAVDGVSLAVAAGEILGVAGVMGNGQSELLEAVAGLRRVASGAVVLDGQDVTHRSVAAHTAAGLAHVPEDRGDRGIVGELSLEENLLLGRHRAFGGCLGLDRGRIRAHAQDLLGRYDVRPPEPGLAARALSGGNAQKLVVAREFSGTPRVLLAGQPTRGVDVGAVEAIHARLREARAGGVAVLLVSADIAEILALADRVLVMDRGRVAGTFPVAEATPERLGECMAGVAP